MTVEPITSEQWFDGVHTDDVDDRYPTELVDPDDDIDEPDTFDLSAGEVAAFEQADRHLEHIGRIRRERLTVEALHRAAVDRLTERYRHQLQRLQRDEDWYAAPVVALHRALLAADPKRKSITLPNGDLKSRTEKRPRFEVVDSDAYVEWARTNAPHTLQPPVVKPDMRAVGNVLGIGPAAALVTVDGKLDVDAHLAVQLGTGEVVPGVVAHPPTTSYRIEPAT